jgi:hypothetical protein
MGFYAETRGRNKKYFYVFLYRTPYTVHRNDSKLTFYEQTPLNIVMFIKNVNIHTYIYEISFGGFEVLSAVLLQFPVF